MRSNPGHYHSRRPGLDFIHDEASDGSSRRTFPQTKQPAASLPPGAVAAAHTADGEVTPFNPAGTDGSQVPVGIVVAAFDVIASADENERRRRPTSCWVLTNRAEVIGSRLKWIEGITAEQKAAAMAQLAALDIAVV